MDIISMKIKKLKSFLLNNLTLISFCVGIVLLICLIILSSRLAFDPIFFNGNSKIDISIAAQYGSFLGGVIGPLVSFVSTLFLITTILYQINNGKKSQLENAFYRLLDYHKANCDNVNLYDESRNMCLVSTEAIYFINSKFEKVYELVESNYVYFNRNDFKNNIDLAYKLIFYGFRESDSIVEEKIISHFKSEDQCKEFLRKIRHNTPSLGYGGHSFNLKTPVQNTLGHYFRNLFYIVKLIDEENSLTKSEKNFYIKILRTQLSTPELFLLVLHSQSSIGSRWNEYISKYKLIKNLPKGYSRIVEHEKIFENIEFDSTKTESN